MAFARSHLQSSAARAAFVARRGAQARIAQALRDKKLVLLAAPAGYGKTSALAHEVAQLPADHALAWVSVEERDDLHSLLDCLFTALEPYDPPWRTAPEALAAALGRAAPDEQRRLTAEVINTLDACEFAHGVIVFDDAHRTDDAAFFRFIDQLVERLGPRWTLAVTARGELPLALPRARARDELAEFRQPQLQFTRDEARVLAQAAGVAQPLADRLFDRTQGWPAGMRIAIGALQARGEGADDPAVADSALRASERPLFELLVSEVLEQLPPPLADFLLAASVLPELAPARCAVVTGDEQAAARLAQIERLGLFVDVLDASDAIDCAGPTLRLHDLFRDALQARLREVAPARHRALLRLVASTETDPLRRIGTLLQAGEVEAAAALAFEHLPPLIVTAGPARALQVAAQFPAAARDRAPELAFVRGLAAWATWDFPTMLAQLAHAEQAFAARGDLMSAQLATVHLSMALMAQGRVGEAQARLAQLRGAPLPVATRILQLNAEVWLAIDDCGHGAVAPLVSEMLDLLQQADRLDLWFQTTPPLRMPGLPGIQPVLTRHAELLLKVAGDTPTPLRALGLLSLAWCALGRGEIAGADALVERGRADAAWSGATGAVRAHLLALTAVMAAIRGDEAAATAAAAARFRTFAASASGWHRYLLAIFSARVVVACAGRDAVRAAIRAVDAERALLPAGTAAWAVPARELPLRAQLAWLEGDAAHACALWERALANEDAIDVMGQAVATRLRYAHALCVREGCAMAAAALAPVFESARRNGGPGGVLLAGDAVHALAAADWRGALDPVDAAQLRTWAALLVSARGERREGSAAAGAAPRSRTDPLTAREMEVLARIAAGDSNKLIARVFDLSLHTVKRHVANILGKLGVDSRGQAAAWYRSLT